jgi:hypothetical protein
MGKKIPGVAGFGVLTGSPGITTQPAPDRHIKKRYRISGWFRHTGTSVFYKTTRGGWQGILTIFNDPSGSGEITKYRFAHCRIS